MRIAIAAMKQDLEDEVSRRGARAAFYFLFDDRGKVVEVIPNPFEDYAHAVGLRVADYLASKQVGVVAAQHLGTDFMDALDRKGVRYVEKGGVIKDVAKELGARFGTLQADAPS